MFKGKLNSIDAMERKWVLKYCRLAAGLLLDDTRRCYAVVPYARELINSTFEDLFQMRFKLRYGRYLTNEVVTQSLGETFQAGAQAAVSLLNHFKSERLVCREPHFAMAFPERVHGLAQ